MFIIGRFKHLIFIVAIIFVVLFFRWNGRVGILENVLYGINKKAKGTVYETLLPYGETEEEKKRALELESEVNRLEYKLARLRDDNQRLRAISGGGETVFTEKGAPARIAGRAPGTWHNEVVAAAGANQGVAVGDIALSGGGLAGKVIRVESETCVIKLLSSPGASASAMIDGKSIFGILHGTGDGALFLESVPADAPIEPGDKVLTSGLGGFYPLGVNIGIVKNVIKKETMLSPVVEVTPVAPLHEILYVVIFIN